MIDIDTANAQSIQAVDFDFDGDLDFMVALWTEIGLYVNDGNGNFHKEIIAFGLENVKKVMAYDIDNDEFMDIFSSSYPSVLTTDKSTTSGFSLWHNQGDQFVETLLVPKDPIDGQQVLFTDIAFADLDVDGVVEIIATTATNQVLLYDFHYGCIPYQHAIEKGLTTTYPRATKIADIDGDDISDVIFAYSGLPGLSGPLKLNEIYQGGAQWLRADYASAAWKSDFTRHAITLEGNPNNFDVADLNNDGRLDLVFSGTNTSIFLNFCELENKTTTTIPQLNNGPNRLKNCFWPPPVVPVGTTKSKNKKRTDSKHTLNAVFSWLGFVQVVLGVLIGFAAVRLAYCKRTTDKKGDDENRVRLLEETKADDEAPRGEPTVKDDRWKELMGQLRGSFEFLFAGRANTAPDNNVAAGTEDRWSFPRCDALVAGTRVWINYRFAFLSRTETPGQLDAER